MKNNVINLVDILNSKNKIKTFDKEYFSKKEISFKDHHALKSMAFILDFFLVVIIKELIVLSYQTFFTNYFYQVPHYTKKALLSGTSELGLSLTIISFMTYFLLTPYLFEGKTLGLKVMKLRLVNKDFYFGQNDNFLISLRESLHRTCGYVLGFFSLGLFAAVPFLTQHKKGIPDMLSNTFVISENDFEAHMHNHSLDEDLVYIDIDSLAA